MFIFQATFFETSDISTWLSANEEYAEQPPNMQYMSSLYWTIVVSYGNAFAYNDIERVFGLCIMLFGGFLMTYSISVVGSIMQGLDMSNAQIEERMGIVNRLYQEYSLPYDLFVALRSQVHHAYDKDMRELNRFVEELPKALRGKTAWYIHEETWEKFTFFKEYNFDNNKEFLAWFAIRLKPSLMLPDTEVYNEKDQVREMFFLSEGACYFQLSSNLFNFKFVKINKGYYFGNIDIVGSIYSLSDEYEEGFFEEEWMEDVERLTRQFNVFTGAEKTEMLTLSIQDIWLLKTEYFEAYNKFINFDEKLDMLKRCHNLKLKARNLQENKLNNNKITVENSDDDLRPECKCHGKI